jgi:hypothetical protein
MLERRRKARFGTLVDGGAGGDDVELGLNPSSASAEGLGPQESGTTTLEQEVDNWDENAVDNWDEADDQPGASGDVADGPKITTTPASASGNGDIGDGKK